jgi:hypothetical protein
MRLVVLIALLGLGHPASAQVPSPSPTPLRGPAVNEVVPTFDAPGMAMSPVHVDFPKGSKTVLIFFQASCPHCQRMIPVWNRAFDRKPADLKVLGILMDNPPPGFFELLHVSFPVLHAPSLSFLRDLKVSTVPVTLRVGEAGKIVDVALGEVDGIRVGQLFAP